MKNLFYDPQREILRTAEEIARKIMSLPKIAVRYAKEAVKRGTDMRIAEGLELEGQLANLVLSSQDALEGIKAFLEGRTPHFQNR